MVDDFHLTIDAFGFHEAQAHLLRIEHGFLRPDWRPAMAALEDAEKRHFVRLKGKYVRTGRLKDSLTLPYANDAIRSVHGSNRAEFGTSVSYARAAGHKGGDWLLVIDERGEREFAELLLEQIVGESA